MCPLYCKNRSDSGSPHNWSSISQINNKNPQIQGLPQHYMAQLAESVVQWRWSTQVSNFLIRIKQLKHPGRLPFILQLQGSCLPHSNSWLPWPTLSVCFYFNYQHWSPHPSHTNLMVWCKKKCSVKGGIVTFHWEFKHSSCKGTIGILGMAYDFLFPTAMFLPHPTTF